MCPRAKHQERRFLKSQEVHICLRDLYVFEENQSSNVAVAAQARVGVKPFQVIYVAEICRFSTGYVTTVAAEAWGIGHLRNRGSGEECEARSETSRHLGKGRWSFTCPKMSQAATSCPLHVHFSRCILACNFKFSPPVTVCNWWSWSFRLPPFTQTWHSTCLFHFLCAAFTSAALYQLEDLLSSKPHGPTGGRHKKKHIT